MKVVIKESMQKKEFENVSEEFEANFYEYAVSNGDAELIDEELHMTNNAFNDWQKYANELMKAQQLETIAIEKYGYDKVIGSYGQGHIDLFDVPRYRIGCIEELTEEEGQ